MHDAPSFTLLDQTDTPRSLQDYRGTWVVLYVYPRDDTPGCTQEACGFRDANESLLAKNAAVIGISKDSVKSHAKFIAKYDLPFTLLSDPDHAAIEALGAWGKAFMGRIGTQRKTFIITPDGKIAKEYPKVTPAEHATQILQDLEWLQRQQDEPVRLV
jgi:thioredoxin-dependent peroxiredoxin